MHTSPAIGRVPSCACPCWGCLQSEVSEPALVRQAAEQGLHVPTFVALLQLAVGGDPTAVALFRRRARLVGRAAAVLLDMFDPEVLVTVEPGTGRMPHCLAELRAEVGQRSRPARYGKALLTVPEGRSTLRTRIPGEWVGNDGASGVGHRPCGSHASADSPADLPPPH
ncbi:ROK family protein [Streptomyces sp. NPDC002926]